MNQTKLGKVKVRFPSLHLLGKRWKHAQVSKIFNVVIARTLCGIPRHRQHILEDLSLAWLLVCVLLTALLVVVLALPLGPHLRRSALKLPSTLSTFSESSAAIS